MIKIGDKELVFGKTFLVPDNVEADLDVKFKPTDVRGLKISIRFLVAEGEEPEAVWEADRVTVRFRFKNWRNPLGTCLTSPFRVGEHEGQPIGITIAHHFVGKDTNVVTLQVYRGGTYE